jgi:hypothetical protein
MPSAAHRTPYHSLKRYRRTMRATRQPPQALVRWRGMRWSLLSCMTAEAEGIAVLWRERMRYDELFAAKGVAVDARREPLKRLVVGHVLSTLQSLLQH